MIRSSVLALAFAGWSSAAAGQAPGGLHAGHVMPPARGESHTGHELSAPAAAAEPTDPHAGHAVAPDAKGPATGGQTVAAAPAAGVVTDHLADQVYGAGSMRRARRILGDEHGGTPLAKLHADLLEVAPDRDGFRWDVEGWYGGDSHRLAFKTEGAGRTGESVEAAEVQLLYSRPVARYTDVQVGLRYDVEPRSRAYAVFAVDAMLPFWFEAEGSLFVSAKGDLLARLKGSYDLRLTQRLVLQPRAELEFAAQDIPSSDIGAGLVEGEFGLRLRYEINRQFAPYVGVSYERAFGRSAGLVRSAGDGVAATALVIGVQAWF